MSRKVVLFIAVSLDGYIATKEESLEWLFNVEGEGDNGYAEFYDTVDTVIMGRKTYDWISTQMEDEFPYKGKQCYIFTTSTEQEEKENITFVNEEISSLLNRLKQQEGKNIWIAGGGGLLQSFLDAEQVDEMIITVAPTLIGKGIRLFPEGDYQLNWRLKGTRTFNQFVELHYDLST
ncbi:dihydrofolate reductase family protein [Alkalicoccobacillus murimartini]|uniref:Dihydrofolate reductase n=1 Tax=Alkalicoccobacillus murimartini TaxID=171685 RepID=A0ABT9YMB0_9BACI|nr:dihydrofolate reductase family protein [Alkalicoccobacillus murimartini]MDQ0208779.1 dihydrofolate reductase [Alkalicoccobacillus murimartini]